MIELSLVDVSKPLLVLVAGPYLSDTNGDPGKIAHNRHRLESFALPIYERGHLPIVGEWSRARELGLAVYTAVDKLPPRGATP
jgi:hypothetical protein